MGPLSSKFSQINPSISCCPAKNKGIDASSISRRSLTFLRVISPIAATMALAVKLISGEKHILCPLIPVGYSVSGPLMIDFMVPLSDSTSIYEDFQGIYWFGNLHQADLAILGSLAVLKFIYGNLVSCYRVLLH